jgi:hypothetical protein
MRLLLQLTISVALSFFILSVSIGTQLNFNTCIPVAHFMALVCAVQKKGIKFLKIRPVTCHEGAIG